MPTINPDKYAELRPFDREEALNNFSYWFPKVADCGIRVPKSVVVPTPAEDELFYTHFFMEQPEADTEAIRSWVQHDVLPALKAGGLAGQLLFIKNGRFSNKFDARWCFCLEHQLVESIININYQALCFDCDGGENEIVIRERIPHNSRTTPCMYNGLPLRSEFRVFYDFDEKKPIFTVNYWDYDYVYPHLYNITDKLVMDYMRDTLAKTFEARKNEIQALVAKHMQNVEGLSGPWSIDIMLAEDGEPILIDMATAERSAYWEMRSGQEPAHHTEEAKPVSEEKKSMEPETLGERIRKIRTYRGMTQRDVAQKAGIEEAQMRRYEYGERTPKGNALQKIAGALDVSMASLRVRKESMEELLPTILYELLQEFGNERLELRDTECGPAIIVHDAAWQERLANIKAAKESLTPEEFKKYLLTGTGL